MERYVTQINVRFPILIRN